jgi:hypothetical protein
MRVNGMRFGRVGMLALLVAGVSACGAGAIPVVSQNPHAGHVFASAPPPGPLREGERFLALSMANPYTPVPPHGGTDEYRCFLVDPQLTAPTYVTGSQFLPQEAEVVHHAIIFAVAPGDVAKANALDQGDDGDGWTCFGGTGVGRGLGGLFGSGWISAWAPGGHETLQSPDTGYLLAPGSQVIMQIHYNLLATGGKAAGPDKSGVRLRLKDGTASLRQLQTTLLAAPIELPCGPDESGLLCDRTASIQDEVARFGGAAWTAVTGLNLLCNGGQAPKAGTTQHCDQTFRQTGEVQAVAGHMHLLGRSIKVELNPDTPAAQTLLDVPVFNFDDQNAQFLPQPVLVHPGDTLRVTCSHDAGLRRQLPELQTLPPRYVVWGDGTSDEMCLGIVIWAAPA